MLRALKLISSNEGKLREMKHYLGPELEKLGFTLEMMPIELVEIQGTADEVIKDKIERASLIADGPVICEDTSLCFTAWKGLPGPYIKHFKDAVGTEGLVKMLEEFPDKSAQAECRIALKVPGKESVIFTGVCSGTIVSPRGQNNFGWDPIFQPIDFNQTFSELAMEVKNSISHRGNAMKLTIDYLKNNPDWFS